MANIQNQQNPPLPKKKRVDSQGNDRRRFIVIDGGATMIIAKGATASCYKCAWENFKNIIEKGGGEVVVKTKPIM